MYEKYSQAGQDKFVLSLFNKDHKGYFLDIGCQLPDEINNTLMLEENGWTGISVDIENYSEQWKTRKSAFVCHDALTCNYPLIFDKYNMPKVIDYLSLDIEGDGTRYQALVQVMKAGHEFKVMTIEHDVYRGYYLSEAWPQRILLQEMGYFLLCSDVSHDYFPYEDWWVNPKYLNESDYLQHLCHCVEYTEIMKKIK